MKKLIIIVVAAIVVMGGLIGTVVGITNSPKIVAMNAVTNAIEDLTKRDEVSPVINAMKGGSLSFSAEGKDLKKWMDLDDEPELSGKLYMNLDKQELMLDKFSVKMGDLSLTGQAYVGTDSVYITNEEILDGTLGLKRGSLVKELNRSVLAPDSGSDYAMSEEDFEALTEIFDALDNKVDQDLQKDLEKVSERYMKKMWKLIGKYAEFESETDNVRINGDRKKARVITIKLDDKAVCLIAEDMVEYLLDDDDLADLVEKYGDQFAESLKSEYGISDLGAKYDDLLDELEKNMDELTDSIKKTMDEDLIITVVTPPASSDLLMLSVEYDKESIVKVEFGHKGVLKTDCITVKFDGSEISYTVKENTRKAFEAKLTVDQSTVATLKIDRSRDEFELELVDSCVLEGDWNTRGKKTFITVDTVKFGDERYYDFKLELVLDESDRMPARTKKMDSILTVDKEDVEKWEEKLNEMLGFDDMLSGTYSYDSSYANQTYTFRGNRFTRTVDMFDTNRVWEGKYYLTTERGRQKITFVYDEGYTDEQTYDFEQGRNYIIIDSVKYTKE